MRLYQYFNSTPLMEPKSLKELIAETRSKLKPQIASTLDDDRIHKFLNANTNNPREAAKALETFYQYQKETLANFNTSAQEIRNIKQAYPHAFSGVDRQGRPVYVELIGSIRITDLFKAIEDQTLVSYFVQKMSYLYKNIFPKTVKKQLLVVIDLKGQLTKIVSKRTYKIVNQIVTVGQNFYPGTLYKILFVNTPMTFQSTWNSIKGEIQGSTLQKVEFMGSDYQQELHKMVDKKYLPECLGGDLSQQEFIKGRGPWMDNNILQPKQPEPQQSDDDSDQDNAIDFSALKAALSNVVPKEHQVRKDVANTPLNTEADDYS